MLYWNPTTRPATAADLAACPVPAHAIRRATVTGRMIRVELLAGGYLQYNLPA